MADIEKKYLDEAGAAVLVEQIKAQDAAKLAEAKKYTDDEIAKVNTAADGLDERLEAVEGAIDVINGADTVDGSLAKVAKDAADAVATEKERAEGVEGDLQDAIDAINDEETGILKVAKNYADGKDEAIAAAKKAGDDAQSDVDALEEVVDGISEKLDTVEEGAQVNVIETVKLNGVALEITDKAVDVVIPNETKNLTYGQIMNPEAEEEDGYHGATDKEVTSAYLYNQLSTILPGVIRQVDGIFDIASNIQYKTVETYEDLQAVDTTEFADGIYVYLVKQDSNFPRFYEKDKNGKDTDVVTQYYTTIYIYLTTQPEAGFELVGQLNVSEALISNATAEAIKSAIMTTVIDPETLIETEVPKFYTRTEGNAVAKAVTDEATRATTAESGLDTRIGALEAKFTGDDSVDKLIEAAVTEAKGYTDDAKEELSDRLDAVEEALGSGEGSVEDKIATAKAEAISAAAEDATTKAGDAEKNAKDYADELDTAMNTRVEALEAVKWVAMTETEIKALFADKAE